MHAKADRETFDTRTGAFVLGMNETGLTAVRCLGRQGISDRGFDIAARRAGFRSRYCPADVCPDPLHQRDKPAERCRQARPGPVLLRASIRFAACGRRRNCRSVPKRCRAGLIQRLVITRVPVLIGEGIPLFGSLPHDVVLEHVRTQDYPSGLVQTEYRVR